MTTSTRNKRIVIWGIVALPLGVLFLDDAVPQGRDVVAASSSPWSGPACGFRGRARHLRCRPLACTLLTILAFFVEFVPGPTDIDLVNRGFSILAIWVAAALLRPVQAGGAEVPGVGGHRASPRRTRSSARTSGHGVITRLERGRARLLRLRRRGGAGPPGFPCCSRPTVSTTSRASSAPLKRGNALPTSRPCACERTAAYAESPYPSPRSWMPAARWWESRPSPTTLRSRKRMAEMQKAKEERRKPPAAPRARTPGQRGGHPRSAPP